MYSLENDSKFLSLVLRHKPHIIGIQILEEGWVLTQELLDKMAKNVRPISIDRLKLIVSEDNKRRYSFKEDFKYIRANQGHSTKVDMKFQPIEPPECLYHGTAVKNLESIMDKGLLKGNRQYVHLSQDRETAKKVGTRHGEPVVLLIESKKMHRLGYEFFQSENGVWLIDYIPTDFISYVESITTESGKEIVRYC